MVTNFKLKMDRGRSPHRKLNNLKLVLEKKWYFTALKMAYDWFPYNQCRIICEHKRIDYLRHTCNSVICNNIYKLK